MRYIFISFIAILVLLEIYIPVVHASGKCDYQSRHWSTMRDVLKEISFYKQKVEGNIQKITKGALEGSSGFYIAEFSLHFAEKKTASLPPNNITCFVSTVKFEAGNTKEEALYSCEATLDAKGKLQKITCDLLAG